MTPVTAFALMDTKYRTNITTYTHEFNQHVQMLPKHLRKDQQTLILIYMHGLRVPGTGLLVVTLKNQMALQGLCTVNQVQNEALKIESVLRSGRSGGNPSVAAAGTYVSTRPASTSSPSSRFSRGTPPRRPTFSTPQSLNHVAAGVDQYGGDSSIDDMNALIEGDGNDDGEDSSDEQAKLPSFHEEDESKSSVPSGGGASADEVEQVMLHAMKAQAKFGDRLKISPEEILRCRKLNLCFKCKRPGHMASACPSTNGQPKNL